MRKSIRGMALLAGACMMAELGAWGQSPSSAKQAVSSIDVAITYDASRANIVPGKNFWLQGGSVQLHGQFWRGLGVVADVSGLHAATISGTGVGLDLVTATFGPRYTWSLKRNRVQVFGQVLAGEANGMNSVFPGVSSADSNAFGSALKVGGGMNVSLSRHLSVRAFEADWLRTGLPNSTTNTQNNLRVGSGLVFRFQ